MNTSIYKLDVFHTDGIVVPSLGKVALVQVKQYKTWYAAVRWARKHSLPQIWVRQTIINPYSLVIYCRWFWYSRASRDFLSSAYSDAEFNAEFCVLDGLPVVSKRKAKG